MRHIEWSVSFGRRVNFAWLRECRRARCVLLCGIHCVRICEINHSFIMLPFNLGRSFFWQLLPESITLAISFRCVENLVAAVFIRDASTRQQHQMCLYAYLDLFCSFESTYWSVNCFGNVFVESKFQATMKIKDTYAFKAKAILETIVSSPILKVSSDAR